ncbi:hypothetical protein PTSG_12534 [Salpingoeca rosetta]|uniref:Uncharacterized protein n=1 Tax=Salpingoeca rosetta (strain ATCC 50818 / BSB-021) TaxID=946362 RepID=F2UDY4_SALR5|nr:uncharacterized protein PTSG_12534 [Salpingoeca rosetta]EGD74834.1 hypothetical protein PTSG_12534 [Salpingoeca rosetta]|eukprot:XP_004992479.1 hypothetical protein PTSG_12534 [Salpingoeca rosetta]
MGRRGKGNKGRKGEHKKGDAHGSSATVDDAAIPNVNGTASQAGQQFVKQPKSTMRAGNGKVMTPHMEFIDGLDGHHRINAMAHKKEGERQGDVGHEDDDGLGSSASTLTTPVTKEHNSQQQRQQRPVGLDFGRRVSAPALTISELEEEYTEMHNTHHTTRTTHVVKTPLSPQSREKLVKLQEIVRSLKLELDRVRDENLELRARNQQLLRQRQQEQQQQQQQHLVDPVRNSNGCSWTRLALAGMLMLLGLFVLLGLMDDEHICADSKDYLTRTAGVFVRTYLPPLPGRQPVSDFVFQ